MSRIRPIVLSCVVLLACSSSAGAPGAGAGDDASDAFTTDAADDTASPGGDAGADADAAPDSTTDAGKDATTEAGTDAMPDGPAPDAPAGDAACVIDDHGGPSSQTAARLGAFYFDGWSGGLNDYHLSQLINGPDGANREPLSGWEDNTACEVEQQLAWASAYGLSYFLFDWFYPPSLSSCSGACWYLNNALGTYRGLTNHHGMGFAINYVDQGSFTIAPADWADAVNMWTDLFTDPDYVRVNGKPLFMVIDYYAMYQAFGSNHAQVKAAWDALRAAAQQKGLPGVYIVAGFGLANYGGCTDSAWYDLTTYEGDGYDAFSMYTYGPTLPASTGPQPFSILTQNRMSAPNAPAAAQCIWDGTPKHTTLPSIPVATVGWDLRPENFTENPNPPGPAMWFDPTPQDVAGLVRGAIDWADGNPASRPEPSPTPPLVFVDAWNELLEGSYLVPTNTRQHTVGDAVAAELAKGSTKLRTALTLQASPVTGSPPYTVSGSLLDSSSNPVSGQISVSLTPTDGPGLVQQYTATGFVPPLAVQGQAVVHANANDGYGPGPAQVVLYRADYEEPGDSVSRVPNGDFASGATGWSFVGPAGYTAGLDGGAAVALSADAGVLAFAGSQLFPVTPDAGYTAGFLGRVAPLSARNGIFLLAFFGDAGSYVGGATIPFSPATVSAGTASTTGGQYSLDITAFGSGGLDVTATYAGDATHWGAFARVHR